MSPEEWSKGLVGFNPVAVLDISQTEGEPLPELETAATRDAGDIVSWLTEMAEALGVTVRIVSEEWSHGEAKGVCKPLQGHDADALVKVKDRSNGADLAGTLTHEHAHALLHLGVDDEDERAKREVEAEAVTYIVDQYFELDMSGSAFYLAAWESDDPAVVRKRLQWIRRTAQEVITTIEV